MVGFVVMSGLPASGKSTLARSIGSRLGLPVLDKDDFLEALFVGHDEVDTARRSSLSRDADERFRAAALEHSEGAVLVSFWRRLEVSSTAGTPTSWLLSLRPMVEVYCECPPTIAVQRFRERPRHESHGDARRSETELGAQFEALAALGPLGLGTTLTVRTVSAVDLDRLVGDIVTAHRRHRGRRGRMSCETRDVSGPPGIGVDCLLLTGTAGAGKSTVAKEIGELMRLDSTGFAVIDLDAVAKCTVDPPVPGRFESELMIANLRAMWPNYRRYGVSRLVLARLVVTGAELAELQAAVPDSRWTVCRLVAATDVIDERLTAREPGISQDFIRAVSRDLAAEMDEHTIADFAVDNSSRSVTDVAREVLVRWRGLV